MPVDVSIAAVNDAIREVIFLVGHLSWKFYGTWCRRVDVNSDTSSSSDRWKSFGQGVYNDVVGYRNVLGSEGIRTPSRLSYPPGWKYILGATLFVGQRRIYLYPPQRARAAFWRARNASVLYRTVYRSLPSLSRSRRSNVSTYDVRPSVGPSVRQTKSPRATAPPPFFPPSLPCIVYAYIVLLYIQPYLRNLPRRKRR